MRAVPATSRIRRLEQTLKESEARRLAVLESAIDCFIGTDAQGRITDFNPAAERTFRIARKKAIRRDMVDLVFPSDLREDHRRELFAQPAGDGFDVLGTRLETRAVRADGAEFPAEVTVTCFAIQRDVAFHVAIRDVTARKKAEETLVRLAAIVESSQDAIIGFDFEGCITSWNRGAEHMSGYTAAEAMGKSVLFLMPEDRVFDYTRCIADLKAGRSLANFETVWTSKSGTCLDVSLTTSSILDGNGERIGGSVIAHDITARKLVEDALRKANQTSMYGSPIPIVAADTRGNVTVWNGAAERAFGWSESEVRGKPNPIISVEDQDSAAHLHARMLAGETLTGIEVRRKRRDGAVLHISLSGAPLWDENGRVRGMIGFLTDITETKRAEQALREAEEQFRGIFENSVSGIYQATEDGRFISANPALARMLGFDSPQELIAACSDRYVVEYVEPGRRREWLALMKRDGHVRSFQSQIRRRDGASMWVSENTHAVHDEKGTVACYEGTVEDITRNRELEDQLRQMQKIEAIGRLAGGVAHDFNNILMAISSYAELLSLKLREAEGTRRYVDEIVRATDRGSSLTQGLLAFSRKQVLSPQVVDLNALVQDQIGMLERLLGEAVALRFRPGKDLGCTRVDPGQVQQVVMNLVINARDAMASGGEVLIETANARLAASGSATAPEMQDYVMLTVTDTGCGIDAAVKSHIFEPFFTTKESGKGTGLGLATVFGIVKQSNGQVDLESEPGKGTSFKVYLPRVEDQPMEVRTELPAGAVAGHETIIVVEDQSAILDSAQEYLVESGYTVLKARNGLEALEVAAQHKGTIHLLLTDVIMPRMSGKELSEIFVGLYPGARVLLMSGYTSTFLEDNGHGGNQKHLVLRKPFRLEVLGRRVREALDGEPLEKISDNGVPAVSRYDRRARREQTV